MAKTPHPTDRHVGSRVRIQRMMLGLSQTDLADGLGLTFQQVQKYEKGTNRIGSSRLQQIAHILKVPVSYFFDGAPAIEKTPTQKIIAEPRVVRMQSFLATSEGMKLVDAFMKIGIQSTRLRVIQLLQVMAGEEDFSEVQAVIHEPRATLQS